MRVFWDCEFTGLHQQTTLISIGCVAEDGQEIYCELLDYDESQLNDWLREHVIAHLWGKEQLAETLPQGRTYAQGTRHYVAQVLQEWLLQWPLVEMWSDCLAYDWVLFCELYGGAFGIPANVYYIPFDLATLLKMLGFDPDVQREEFAQISKDRLRGYPRHNALWDAAGDSSVLFAGGGWMTPMRNKDAYPIDWVQLSYEIRDANDWQCQGCGKQCTRPGESYAGARYVLTVAHYDPFSYDQEWAYLVPLCAPCHLRLDSAWSWYFRHRNQRRRRQRAGQLGWEWAK